MTSAPTTTASYAETIAAGRATLGIELGSTRIKACLIGDDPSVVIASGSHEWENQLVDGVWTYALDDVWTGLQAAYADLVADIRHRYDVEPTGFAAIGVSAMMHGYLAFDSDGELLVPFRTWRNTSTGEAATELHGVVRRQHPAAVVDCAPAPGRARRRAACAADSTCHHPCRLRARETHGFAGARGR